MKSAVDRPFRPMLTLAVTLATVVMLIALPAKAQDIAVKIDNFVFVPDTLTIHPGDTVTWQNVDDIPHTVSAVKGAFRSKALDTEDTFSFTFSNIGEFEYFCGLHPHMKGKVIVAP